MSQIFDLIYDNSYTTSNSRVSIIQFCQSKCFSQYNIMISVASYMKKSSIKRAGAKGVVTGGAGGARAPPIISEIAIKNP